MPVFVRNEPGTFIDVITYLVRKHYFYHYWPKSGPSVYAGQFPRLPLVRTSLLHWKRLAAVRGGRAPVRSPPASPRCRPPTRGRRCVGLWAEPGQRCSSACRSGEERRDCDIDLELWGFQGLGTEQTEESPSMWRSRAVRAKL